MFVFQVGDILVSRIVEMEMPLLVAKSFFPDWNNQIVEQHKQWLIPRHFDPVSGKVVINIQAFLIETPRSKILVDTCVGNHKSRNRDLFNQANLPWFDNFTARGILPEDIDFVICTHMHVDHVGWNTRLRDGRWVPTFPNAKYIFAKNELKYWLEQSQSNLMGRTGDYIVDSVIPILEAKREIIVDKEHDLEDGIRLIPLPGHTPGMVGVDVCSRAQRAILCGDLMHHIIQCHQPDWSTIACADMKSASVTRKKFFENYADTNVLIFPSHFPNPTGGFVLSKGDEFVFSFIEE